MFEYYSDKLGDNIGGQRSKFDIIATILHISTEPSLKNHIIGKGNFSDAMINHYLSILLYHNLISSSKDESERTYYSTTEKGQEFIRRYKEIQQLFANAKKQEVKENSKDPREEDLSSLNSNQDTATQTSILIVDDETDIGSAMKIGLEDNGFKVQVYDDPIEALTNYKPNNYDLLLFDVKMPRMGGFELYRKIREIDQNAKVCFLTAFEMYSEEFKKVFPSMDVRHFIQKPISMSELVEKIRTIMETA